VILENEQLLVGVLCAAGIESNYLLAIVVAHTQGFSLQETIHVHQHSDNWNSANFIVVNEFILYQRIN